MSSAEKGWLRAVDEELVMCHLGIAGASDTYEEAKRKLGMLIQWHVDVATDPLVNGGYPLVKQEGGEAQDLFKALKLYKCYQIELMLSFQAIDLNLECVAESELHAQLMADKLIELEQSIKRRYGIDVKDLLDAY